MRNQLSVAILATAISSVWGLGAAWGQTPQPKKPEWKDRAEYDLEQSAENEKDPKKKLDLLNQWKQNYPNTDYRMLRLDHYLATYRVLQDGAKILETAQEMLKEDPKYITGLYWTCLLVNSDASPARLDIGEKAANTLLGNLDEFFAPDKKPAGATDAAWKQARTDLEALAHRTLGWVNMQRKNLPDAEKHISEDLKLNPNDAQASYWLGNVIRLTQKPERTSEALFAFARSAAYEGPGAMDAISRQKALDYTTKLYNSYHGQDADGLKQLLALAKGQAVVPAGFKILSEEEVKEQKLLQKGKDNPSLPFWVKFIKEPLKAADGAQTFESNVKNALIPPESVPPLQGAVISCDPPRNPKTVIVGIENPGTPEVKLVFEAPLGRPADAGTIIKFRGVATAFTKEPFLVTFEVDKKDLTGWPAPPPPVRKAPVHRATKKK